MFGVLISEPYAPKSAYPVSSNKTTMKLGGFSAFSAGFSTVAFSAGRSGSVAASFFVQAKATKASNRQLAIRPIEHVLPLRANTSDIRLPLQARELPRETGV